MIVLRFDFRVAPHSPATTATLMSASLDMAEWADQQTAAMVLFSEHHGSDDGYLPSPLVMAAAAVGRTTSLPVNVGALLALMYDPIKLAEDIAVLDHVSGGRVSYTVGLGYRSAEYAMFGIDPARRGAEMDERLDVLRRALDGERFTWRGRPVAVTPTPATPGGPALAYGGGSVAAARRAARFGMLFVSQTHDPTLIDAYDAEARRCGTAPGLVVLPSPDAPTAMFVADDIDTAWSRLGPYLLHDAMAYARWMGVDANAASYSAATTVDALRAEAGAYRIVSREQARERRARDGIVSTHPLCGGIPPDWAWESLRLLEG